MRYILDNEGYIFATSLDKDSPIECELGSCTEYIGELPDGYGSLYEWQCNANIRAYKIVNGNLIYDALRDVELQEIYDEENEKNSYVTHKELSAIKIEQDENLVNIYDINSLENSNLNRLNVISNSANLKIDKLDIRPNTTITDILKVFFTTSNLLPNDFTSIVLNGITFEQNSDKSIRMYGTSTADCELNLAGTDEQIEGILYFLANTDYYLNGLDKNISLKFYDYDGTDRSLIGEYSNNTLINSSIDKKITQITLNILNGVTLDTTIYPMLQKVNENDVTNDNIRPYSPHKMNKLKINLRENVFSSGDRIIVENETIYLLKNHFIVVGTTLSNNTLYFDFPNDLYESLPSENTTIIQGGETFKIYVLDKKIFLELNSVTIPIYDPENDVNLESYTLNIEPTQITKINNDLGFYDYITLTTLEDAIYLGTTTMPNTYYQVTNIYSDKNASVKVIYRNTDEFNTDVIKIGSFKITKDGLSSDIIPDYVYTQDDVLAIREYLIGIRELTFTQKLLYDFSGDGQLMSNDALLIERMLGMDEYTTPKEPARLEINSRNPYKTILLKDKNGNERININLKGFYKNGVKLETKNEIFSKPIERTAYFNDVKCKNLFPNWIIGKSINTGNGGINNNTNGAISNGYIPVNFNENTNYFLSGLTSDLRTFVAAYNSNKEFLGRTGANRVNEMLLSNDSFTSGTAQGSGDIAYLLITSYTVTDSVSDITQVNDLATQLEVGNAETQYTLHKKFAYTMLDFYPIGSIYTNTNSTNPFEYFGGIWEQIDTNQTGRYSWKRIL